MSSPEALLQIGFVLRAHGLRGGLRVRATSDALLGLKRVVVGGRSLALRGVRRDKDEFLVELEGVSDRDAAEALRGQAVEAYRTELAPLDEDELYVADLVGCRVLDSSGASLGEVVGTFDSGAHEILVVHGEGREILLPFVEAIVTEVDLAARLLRCDPPPGLVELGTAEGAGPEPLEGGSSSDDGSGDEP